MATTRRPLRFLHLRQVLCLIAMAVPWDFAWSGPGDRPTPTELARRVDRLLVSTSSHARATLTVRRPGYKRQLTMESWSQHDDDFLVRVLSPASQAGHVTLKRGGKLWQYIPRLDRVIRLPSGVMGSAWMGSHFTNDDLVRAAHYHIDFTARFAADPDPAHWLLVLEPRPTAPVVWSRLNCLVEKKNALPVHITYLDERNRIRRTLTFSDYRTLPGRDDEKPRTVPFQIHMKPADEEGESTFHYDLLELDVPIQPGFFEPRRLRRR